MPSENEENTIPMEKSHGAPLSQEEDMDFHSSLSICLNKINLLFKDWSTESLGVKAAQGLHVPGLAVHPSVNFIPAVEQLRPHDLRSYPSFHIS